MISVYMPVLLNTDYLNNPCVHLYCFFTVCTSEVVHVPSCSVSQTSTPASHEWNKVSDIFNISISIH